jgi:hypothetical protein
VKGNPTVAYGVILFVFCLGLFLFLRPATVQKFLDAFPGLFGPQPRYSRTSFRIGGVAFMGFAFYLAYLCEVPGVFSN